MKKLSFLLGLLICLHALSLDAQIPRRNKNKDKANSESNEGGRASRFLEKAKEKAAKVNPMAAVQRAMGEVLTSTQNRLDSVSVSVLLEQNVQPINAANIGIRPKEWTPNGNALMVYMTKRHSAGLVKVDGDVMMNGQNAEYAGVGTYFQNISSVAGTQKVSVSTSGGSKAEVSISPAPSLALQSVNGISTDQPISVS
ncbi:MAG: hypothetical protein AAFQ68_08900, partial [Bacteroidota bacterium]